MIIYFFTLLPWQKFQHDIWKIATMQGNCKLWLRPLAKQRQENHRESNMSFILMIYHSFPLTILQTSTNKFVEILLRSSLYMTAQRQRKLAQHAGCLGLKVVNGIFIVTITFTFSSLPSCRDMVRCAKISHIH